MTDNPAGTPLDALQKQLRACWLQACTDLGALIGQPLKFRSESLEELGAAGLVERVATGSLSAPLSLDGDSPLELEVLFSPTLALVLAGVLNVQRPEEIAARVKAGTLEDADRTAVGELANILSSAFEEPLRGALNRGLHIARGELCSVEERAEAWRAADPQDVVVQRLTLSVAGMGDGEILLVLPVELGRELAGGALDSAPAADTAPEAAGAAVESPARRAAPVRRAVPPPTFAGGGDDADPRVLIAGPVAQDTSEVEQVFVLQGTEVVVCSRLREIGTTCDPTAFTLVVLAVPPGSLAALPMIRSLAALPEAPAVVVATRSATPSLVFQAVRAGADYVVVLPPSDAAMDRLFELSRRPRRAAA